MKQVKNNWLEAFPKLKPIGTNKFFEILGPILIGIELVKSSYGDEYKPYLVVCSFWNSDVLNNKLESELKRRLNNPNIYLSLNKDNGVEFNIGYYDYKLIPEAISRIKKQFLPLERDVKIDEIFDYIDYYKSYSNIPPDIAGVNAILLEFKYLICKYLGNKVLTDKILEEINENYMSIWDKSSFENWIGDYNLWLKRLKHISREELVSAVNNFKQDPKIKKLNAFRLIE